MAILEILSACDEDKIEVIPIHAGLPAFEVLKNY